MLLLLHEYPPTCGGTTHTHTKLLLFENVFLIESFLLFFDQGKILTRATTMKVKNNKMKILKNESKSIKMNKVVNLKTLMKLTDDDDDLF
jgi:hypothetical protein